MKMKVKVDKPKKNKRRVDKAEANIKLGAEKLSSKKMPSGETYGEAHKKKYGVAPAGMNMKLSDRGQRIYNRKKKRNTPKKSK